jgi:putative membrane protein
MRLIRYNLLLLAAAGLITVGCSNNKAATPDTSSAQPSSSSSATTPNSNTSANADQKFVEDAAKGNRAEVELGKMVESKAKDPAVKQFAQMMVKDHTDALNQLQKLAQSKNITLPDGVPSDAQDLQQKLSTEQGKQFEKDYMSGMVEDHQKDVQEFQDASQNLKDSDLKQWAGTMLPKLQQHLAKAQAVDSQLNGKTGSSSSGGSL